MRPPLDPGFVPASLWRRAYIERAAVHPATRDVTLALTRDERMTVVHGTRLLPDLPEFAEANLRFAERLLKFLLWQVGAWKVHLAGADEIAARLSAIYSPGGGRAFDFHYMGETLCGRPFVIEACREEDLPAERSGGLNLGRHLDGCRIGFDLGGSDRKAAAVIDGEVVFSEEIPWDPYFHPDPSYHFAGIRDSLRRAASHLPRVDAIGGSAAGVYVDNEVRAASIFRGISPEDFRERVVRIFFDVMKAEGWEDVPWQVVNDGDVTALAGSMSLDANPVLGISMGTSQAAGYVDPSGLLQPWLSELAFAPVDYRPDGPVDEWSKDSGCGVQFFSQQAVVRLAAGAGIPLSGELSAPEVLSEIQDLLAWGDRNAEAIFDTIGCCFGYGLAHYAEFYTLENVLVLGRVTSGAGGARIIDRAREVLCAEFPDLAGLRITTPDETDKRHGQAIAAASLPAIAPDASRRAP